MAGDSQTLAEAAETRDNVHLVCKDCGAHQPVYVKAMIDKHGPDNPFETALRRWGCLICGTTGKFTVFQQ